MGSIPPGAPDELPQGHLVADRYLVEGLLGRGGMGAVYAALDRKLGRRVALKVVLAAASGATRRRLETEARAVASVEHPGIVTLYDVVEHAGALVLVMELVQGVSLRGMLEGGPLPPGEVARVVLGIAEALEAAHARGLVHRDVKPDNVMIRRGGRIALLDFGVAKAVAADDADPLAPTATADGAVVGTPAYLAPEQARGEAVTPATDQFALAVTTYELLTGTTPWRRTSMPALVAAIVADAPPPIQTIVPGKAVDLVLARGLAKSAAARYPSVSAFARALDETLGAVAGGSTIRSTPPRAASDELRPGPTPLELAATAHPSSRDFAAGPTIPARRRPPRWWLLAVPLVSAALIVGFAARRLYPAAAALPSASPAATGRDGATEAGRWEDLPASGAKRDADRAAYREAVSALKRGNLAVARRSLDAAIERDPDFAGAYLLRAYCSYIRAAGLDAPGRAAFRAAAARRQSLTARDAELLDALTPSFLDPPKWEETGALLADFVRVHPSDAQGWDALALARTRQGDKPAAAKAYQAEMAVDPDMLVPYVIIAQMAVGDDDVAQAERVLKTCTRLQPTETLCRNELASILAGEGRCAEADEQARNALSLDPRSSVALNLRALATAGLDAPGDVVAGLLRQHTTAIPAERSTTEGAVDAFLIATRAGDFDAALRVFEAPDLESAAARSGELGAITAARVRTLWETGDRARAADVANSYLAHAAERQLPETVLRDPTARLLAYAHAAGAISGAERQKRRDAWVAAWRARRTAAEWTAQEVGPRVWGYAYAPVDPPTADEGGAALDALSTLGLRSLPRRSANPDPLEEEWSGVSGSLLMAAGRLDEAERELKRATRTCRVAPDQRARLALAQLYELRADTAHACATYAEIENAWSRAKPKSVTLDAARAASKRLRCGSRP